MRLAASQVGRGASASTFGDMAAAACAEAGTKNVSAGDWAHNACCSSSAAFFETNAHACDRGTRFAAGLARGENKHNAERDIMAALRRSHGVPCAMNYV